MDNELLKELQKVELEILLEVDRVCKKHNIKYFLVSGTLLGAIRHKGFIPWDDDIDICMPVSDYRRFCKIAQEEIGENYFLQNYNTDYTNIWFAKIRKNGTTAIEAGHEARLNHQGVWVDIFPLIGVKKEEKWLRLVTKQANFAKWLLGKKLGLMEEEKLPVYKMLHRLLPLKVFRLFCKLIYKVTFKPSQRFDYCYYLWGSKNITARFISDLFDELCEVEFEGHMFPAPKRWDEYLTKVYGDYMTPPPPEKRTGGCHTISIVDLDNDYSKHMKNK